MTTPQYLVLLAYSFATFKSSASYDPITLEQLRAIVERCLVAHHRHGAADEQPGSLNWLIYSLCLWFRSRAEFHRFRTHDRALLQLQMLVDQFWSRHPEPSVRLLYAGQVSYPLRGDAALTLGHAKMKSGAYMSAFEMFKEMWMWEEAAECLIAAGRKTLALDLLTQRLSTHPTPCILCCIGDIKEDPIYYEKAW